MNVARDTAAEIQEALSIERTTESAAAIKRAVARSLSSVDASLKIETTEYFNHSFAPDLVLKWEYPPTRDERYVFLRFNDKPEWITEELPRLAKHRPVVYGLSETLDARHAETLATQSQETETLVTDPAGVDQLASAPPAGIGSFVSRTLVRGGRGLVDERGALRATTEISSGFEAARAGDASRTRVAAEAAQEFLRPGEASRLLRFLQAMWVGAGAPAETFPAPVERTGDPGDEGLKFLIEHEEIDDRDFWRALGESLTIERLAQLGITGSPRNLQHVVLANLDKLWARAFRVRPDQPRLDETGQELLWRMEMGLLALAGSNFTAYLGTSVDEIAGIKSEGRQAGVTVEELRTRARAVAVDSLELSNGQRIVTYGSPDPHADVSNDDELAALADALGSATVQRATITVEGRHLELDFTTATASARTSARPPLTDILGVGLPLVWPLTGRELQAFISMMAAARDQQTLELLPLPDDDLIA